MFMGPLGNEKKKEKNDLQSQYSLQQKKKTNKKKKKPNPKTSLWLPVGYMFPHDMSAHKPHWWGELWASFISSGNPFSHQEDENHSSESSSLSGMGNRKMAATPDNWPSSENKKYK